MSSRGHFDSQSNAAATAMEVDDDDDDDDEGDNNDEGNNEDSAGCDVRGVNGAAEARGVG